MHRPTIPMWIVAALALCTSAVVVDAGGIGAGNRIAGATIQIASAWQGTLPTDTVWGPRQGPCIVAGELVVPKGVTLTILPGTMVLFQEGSRMVIHGRLVAEGTTAEPVRFTRAADKGRWLGLQFNQTVEDNRIRHALLEYARTDDGMIGLQKSRLLLEDAEFDHCDRRRIRTLDSSLIVRRCRFDDMFGPSEPPTTDNMSENIWGSGIPDGGWLIVEDSVFGRNKGHNDAIDFDGPASPKPFPHIRNNTFLGGGDDALDLECDALIEGNLFMNFVRDRYNKASGEANVLSAGAGKHYTLAHNIFINSQHIAQVKDNAFLTFINNSGVNISGAGIYFELGLPGRKPGRGATIENCIFWTTPLVFEGIADQTALTVNYSLLPRKWHHWGTGNIDADPLFVKPGYWDSHGTPNNPDDDTWIDGDYHLKSQAGRWDAGRQRWIEDDVTSPCIDAGDPNADWTAELWPHGRRINMGAYGGTAQAGMSLSNAGDTADLNHDGTVDARDLLVLADGWLVKEAPLAQDMSRDGSVNLLDLGKLAGHWRADPGSEREPFDIALGVRAQWSGLHKGYDPNLPGYRIAGDIASVTLRARIDDLPAKLVLAIRTSPGMAPMLEDFTCAAPCVMLSGEPFKDAGLTCSKRADSSLSWEVVPDAATDTYFKFDAVGDEVHVTFLPAAIELLRMQCRISWIDRYR